MSALEEHLEQTYDVDVEEQLAREADDTDPAQPQRFVVDDEDKANWAMRKLARLRRRQAANVETANKERARIDEWVTSENDTLERQAQFFEALLIEFHLGELGRDPKRKTIKLPTGIIESRARQAQVDVDIEAFIEWARKERPEFIRTKFEVEKAAVKEAAVKDGEVLPHVTVTPLDRSFTVKPKID